MDISLSALYSVSSGGGANVNGSTTQLLVQAGTYVAAAGTNDAGSGNVPVPFKTDFPHGLVSVEPSVPASRFALSAVTALFAVTAYGTAPICTVPVSVPSTMMSTYALELPATQVVHEAGSGTVKYPLLVTVTTVGPLVHSCVPPDAAL